MELKCAVIGLGYWGPNLARNVLANEAAQLTYVCDQNPDRLRKMKGKIGNAIATTDMQKVLESKNVDAVLIATPVSSHFAVACAALEQGKHVFVEKPLAASVAEAEELIARAKAAGRVLMVDHIFVYTPAVRRIREMLDGAALGDIYYYDSVRINLGLFQHDVNVIWDLAVHDLSIMDYLIAERPRSVSARAVAHVKGRPENIAYLTCDFESGLIAHVHVNWLAPVKVRQTLIGGSQKMVVYDDIEPDEKVKIYDRGVDLNSSDNAALQLGYRLGDMWAPMLDRTEALNTAISHFVDCATSGKTPITDGQCGLRVVRLLEAATRSVTSGGQAVSTVI